MKRMPGGRGAIYAALTTGLWSQEKRLHAWVINPGSKYLSLALQLRQTGRCVEVSCWALLDLFLQAEARLSGAGKRAFQCPRSNANPDGPSGSPGHPVARSGCVAARAGSTGRWGEAKRARRLEVDRWGTFPGFPIDPRERCHSCWPGGSRAPGSSCSAYKQPRPRAPAPPASRTPFSAGSSPAAVPGRGGLGDTPTSPARSAANARGSFRGVPGAPLSPRPGQGEEGRPRNRSAPP